MKTPRTRYAYVPLNRGGADIESDAQALDYAGRISGPAGKLICTVDGSEPFESNDSSMDGRYAQTITRKTAERAFGREYVSMVREEARDRAAA